VAVAPTHSRLAAFSAGGLDVEVHLWDIPYLVPFRIARPDPNEESSCTAFVHITDRATGLEGWGEGCADPYYGDTPETIAAVAPLLFSVALPAIDTALAEAGGASTGTGYTAARSTIVSIGAMPMVRFVCPMDSSAPRKRRSEVFTERASRSCSACSIADFAAP